MEKFNLGKPTAIIHKNVNRKELYLDVDHATPLKDDIVKQLEIISKSFEEISALLNKMSYKKMFDDECSNISLQCAKKSSLQGQTAKSLSENFDLIWKLF